jgi:hypothetical protein
LFGKGKGKRKFFGPRRRWKVHTKLDLKVTDVEYINPLNAELNPICHLLALLRARHILHVSGIRVKLDIPGSVH